MGVKGAETRPWATTHRGLVAIHASKRIPKELRPEIEVGDYTVRTNMPGTQALMVDPFGEVSDLPMGAVVGTGNLFACIPTTCALGLHPERSIAPTYDKCSRCGMPRCFFLKEEMQPYGDYRPGRFAWLFTDIVRFDEPIPATGAQGL